ncbi:MAG: alpha/beta hydrolase fold domain-containing protein [Litorimonas sp.]
MTSLRYKFIQGILRATKYRDKMLKDLQNGHARHMKPSAKLASRFERTEFNGQAVWICKPKTAKSGKVYIHIHGGGFVYGLQAGHYMSLCEFADKSGAIVMLPDYPLPPIPAEQMGEWSLAQYLSVAEDYGQENVYLGGCSAGANLVLVVSQLLSARGLRQPVHIQLLSPWLDLYTRRELTPEENNETLITADALVPARENYAQDRDFQDPLISPAFMELSDLPPVHIVTGEKDILFADIRIFADRLKAAGKLTSYRAEAEYGHYWMFYPAPDRHPTLEYMAGLLR